MEEEQSRQGVSANKRGWERENPERAKEADRRRRRTPKGRVTNTIRSGIHRGLIKGGKCGKKTFESLGYTPEELMEHIERQFLPGMSWDNYDKHGWHIDHIRPLATFNYETVDDPEFKQAWALSNLQPLWAVDNWRKSYMFIGPLKPANDNEPKRDAA